MLTLEKKFQQVKFITPINNYFDEGFSFCSNPNKDFSSNGKKQAKKEKTFIKFINTAVTAKREIVKHDLIVDINCEVKNEKRKKTRGRVPFDTRRLSTQQILAEDSENSFQPWEIPWNQKIA